MVGRELEGIIKGLSYLIYYDATDRQRVIDELVAFDWSRHFSEIDAERQAQKIAWENSLGECVKCHEWFTMRELKRKYLGGGLAVGGEYCQSCLAIVEADFHGVCACCGKAFRRRKPNSGVLCQSCKKHGNRELEAVRRNNYRAQQRGLDHNLSFSEWFGVLSSFGWRCAYCGGEYEAMDHVIPISKGGGTTATNCVPACNSCNSKKAQNTILT